nr:hypothetical protein CFP56_04617 [Quercus suber]
MDQAAIADALSYNDRLCVPGRVVHRGTAEANAGAIFAEVPCPFGEGWKFGLCASFERASHPPGRQIRSAPQRRGLVTYDRHYDSCPGSAHSQLTPWSRTRHTVSFHVICNKGIHHLPTPPCTRTEAAGSGDVTCTARLVAFALPPASNATATSQQPCAPSTTPVQSFESSSSALPFWSACLRVLSRGHHGGISLSGRAARNKHDKLFRGFRRGRLSTILQRTELPDQDNPARRPSSLGEPCGWLGTHAGRGLASESLSALSRGWVCHRSSSVVVVVPKSAPGWAICTGDQTTPQVLSRLLFRNAAHVPAARAPRGALRGVFFSVWLGIRGRVPHARRRCNHCLTLAFSVDGLGRSGSCLPTVYLIRHGEKPSDGSNGLSAQGMQRAQCLRNVFGASSQYDIGYIMAETPKSSGARARPYDTVEPLAQDLGLNVDTSCDRDDQDCVADVVESYNGSGNILICWEHDALTDIVKALGDKNAPDYPDNSFNIIWTDPPSYKSITAMTNENCPGLDN